jgi:myo-inositol-1(or 4)-monophosphatase
VTSMMELDLDKLLDVAVRSAQKAGQHAIKNYRRRKDITQRFEHDVKLELDLECQEKAEQVIRKAYPEHNILGEEKGTLTTGPEPLWIIDPIDGTVNFLHGIPLWCASVAVQVEGRIVAGAVFLPEMEECYTATIHHLSRCNGKLIHASEVKRLEDALVLTGLSKHVHTSPEAGDVFRAVSERAQKVRIMGAAAVDICHVACGRADGYIETGIYLWDVAAGGLIAERAGARIEVLEKIDALRMRFLCTNGHIHEPLKQIVTSALKRA